MNKKDFGELKGILSDIANRVTAVEKSHIVVCATVKSWDEDFRKIKTGLSNVEVVCAETAKQVNQIHSSVIDTASKIGDRVRKLELVKDVPSAGRRPAKKNQ